MPINYTNYTGSIRTEGASNSDINRFHNVYVGENLLGSYTHIIDKKDESSDKPDSNYNSMEYNSLEPSGYIVMGNNWTIHSVITGVGRFWVPSSNSHTFDRSATVKLDIQYKVPTFIQKVGSNKNGSMRFLPNKTNPRIVDLYPFSMLSIIMNGKSLGMKEAFKNDILTTNMNTMASYLGKKEEYYLDRTFTLRHKDTKKQALIPELSFYNGMDMAFRINTTYPKDYRRKVANFQYWGINNEMIIYEDNPNATNDYLNLLLKTQGKEYELISCTEEVYEADSLIEQIILKYFDDYENGTFTYKDKTYKIDARTNVITLDDKEVLYIEMDNGSLFTFNYEKAIANIVNDKIKPDIDKFLEYIRTRTIFDSNYNRQFYQLARYKSGHHSDGGEHASGGMSYYNTIANYKSTAVSKTSIWRNYTGDGNGFNQSNYSHNEEIVALYNRFRNVYNSPNIVDVNTLFEINADYVNNEYIALTRQADESSQNASYENSFYTPIICQNYSTAYYQYSQSGYYEGSPNNYTTDLYWNENTETMGYVNGYTDWTYGYPNEWRNREYSPSPTKLGMFYNNNTLGYNHSGVNENYIVPPNTTKLESVLDNYQGYVGEGLKIVYKYDEQGNPIQDEQTGMYEIDYDKSTFPVNTDVDSSSSQSRRLFKSLKSYPKLIDFYHLSLDDSIAHTFTTTYNEISRTGNDTTLTIEVEALFQCKELKYTFDLPYLKLVSSAESGSISTQWIKDYSFCPFIYIYDTDNFDSLTWKQVKPTKKYQLNFIKEAIEETDKIGEKYIKIVYLDKETNEQKEIQLNNTTLDEVKNNLSGGIFKVKMTKTMPQLFTYQSNTKLCAKNHSSYVYYSLFFMINSAAISALIALASVWLSWMAPAIWSVGIAVALATRRNVNMQSYGYSNKIEGDAFYNIGNRWEWIYRKNNGERNDLFDKFENPSFYMDVIDKKKEKKIKLNPPVSRLYGDRDFKPKKYKYDAFVQSNVPASMSFVERNFASVALSADEILNSMKRVNPKIKKTKFKGGYSEKENKIIHFQNNPIQSLQGYISGDCIQNISHIFEGQKFSLTYLLNNNFRKTHHLVKLAYEYLNYLCLNNNVSKQFKNIEVVLPSRLQIYPFIKQLRMKREVILDKELLLLNKQYSAEFIGDILVIYNKKDRIKISFDFHKYIPDFRQIYGVSSSGINHSEMQNSLVPIFEKLYKGEQLDNKTYKGWNSFYKTNIQEISNNNLYLPTPKLNRFELQNHMQNFVDEYLNSLDDKILLDLYNEKNNTEFKTLIKVNSTTNNTLDVNKELDRFINNKVENANSTEYSFAILSKMDENPIWATIEFKQDYRDTTHYYNSFNSVFKTGLGARRTTYDIRTMTLLYQIELEKMLRGQAENLEDDVRTKTMNSFYTYLDADETCISKKQVIDFIKENLTDIMPKQDYYMTLAEFKNIMSVNNEYTQLFDIDNSSPNSIAYNLWIGYYVVPNNVKEIIDTYISEGISWNTLLEKDAMCMRSANTKPNSYITCYLPMYVDIYRKLPYAVKKFLNGYCYTYDCLVDMPANVRRTDYDAKLIRVFIIWSGLWLTFLAVIISIIVAIIAIICTPFTGGTSLAAGLAIIASVCAVLATVALTISFVCMAIGAYTSNPVTAKRMNNMSKSFSQASTVLGAMSAIFNVASSVAEGIKQGSMTALKFSGNVLKAGTAIGALYHTLKGNQKDAIGWSIASMALQLAETGKQIATQGVKSLTAKNIIDLTNQSIAITNNIVYLFQTSQLDKLQSEILKLEEINKQLEKEKEKEEEKLLESVNYLAVITSDEPIRTSFENSLPLKITTDAEDYYEVIDAEFEVLNIQE